MCLIKLRRDYTLYVSIHTICIHGEHIYIYTHAIEYNTVILYIYVYTYDSSNDNDTAISFYR